MGKGGFTAYKKAAYDFLIVFYRFLCVHKIPSRQVSCKIYIDTLFFTVFPKIWPTLKSRVKNSSGYP